jgi:hypothetical protein
MIFTKKTFDNTLTVDSHEFLIENQVSLNKKYASNSFLSQQVCRECLSLNPFISLVDPSRSPSVTSNLTRDSLYKSNQNVLKS